MDEEKKQGITQEMRDSNLILKTCFKHKLRSILQARRSIQTTVKQVVLAQESKKFVKLCENRVCFKTCKSGMIET